MPPFCVQHVADHYRFGRKPIILVGLEGFGVSFIVFGLATSLWMLFAARILGGTLSAVIKACNQSWQLN